MPQFFKLNLPENPSGGQDKNLGPLFNAIHILSRVLDNLIGGSQGSEALRIRAANLPSGLAAGEFVFVSGAGTVTKDWTQGYNAVYLGAGVLQFQSAIVHGLPSLSPGLHHWLDLDSGIITSTPNPNSRLQCLGVAMTTSDLHFTYSAPVNV